MFGKNKVTVCITGTNQCSLDALNYAINNKKKLYNLVALIDKSDTGKDGWQPSFKKFVKKKKIKIVQLKNLYKLKNLYLFSLEYRNLINVKMFNSNNLFNIHFSLLPKYRGCHTNFLQIKNGEKISGVTLHKIDKGIDTGPIVDSIKFKLSENTTGYENYIMLMKLAKKIFIKNFKFIIKNKYQLKKQNNKKSTYYSRNAVNYSKLTKINLTKHTIQKYNLIRSLIFPPFQYPVVNGQIVKKILYKKKKIKLN